MEFNIIARGLPLGLVALAAYLNAAAIGSDDALLNAPDAVTQPVAIRLLPRATSNPVAGNSRLEAQETRDHARTVAGLAQSVDGPYSDDSSSDWSGVATIGSTALASKPGVQPLPIILRCFFASDPATTGGAVVLIAADETSQQDSEAADGLELTPSLPGGAKEQETHSNLQTEISAAGRAMDAEATQSSPRSVGSLPVARLAAVDADTADANEPDPDRMSEADRTGECPGSPESHTTDQIAQPDDIPLEQAEHPYDAPDARQSDEPERNGQTHPTAQLTYQQQVLQARINQCLHYYLTHPESVSRRGPWALMHAILPFGVETEVLAGNRRVNAIGWMCYNGVCAKQRIFQPTRTGFRTNLGPGVQGHEGQFLAILAQSKVRSDYPLQVGNRRYTIQDLVNYEMRTCREKSELTFKLIGLSHYLESDQRWRDDRGHWWNLEKMVAEELAQPINGVACGGTHRLMGLTYAVIKREQGGQPISGHWYRAQRFVGDYVNYALSLQNPDGSFSTEWLESRGNDPDIERKVQTTGHILEWLIFTVPDEHLQSPRIVAAVEFLLDTVGSDPARDWPIGPRGHALRALALYNQRVFGAEPGQLRAHFASLRQASQR